MAEASGWSGRIALLVSVVGLVSGGIGAAAAYFAIPREERKVDISETGADRDYLLKVTDKALQLAVSDKLKQRCLVSYLVATLPDRYEDYRSGLLQAVDEADTTGATSFCVQRALDNIAERQTAAIAAETQPAGSPPATQDTPAIPAPASAAPAVAPTSTVTASTTSIISATAGRYALDVFWCDGSSDAPGRQVLATTIATAMGKLPDLGRVRVRPLPQEVNAQPGYGINQNVVRFEQVEAPVARRLITAATSSSGLPFTGKLITYRTANYVSMFVCGTVAR